MTGWKLRLAKKLIDNGGVIAYPTESVFGLGCDPLNYSAVERLCQLKNRSLSKGLILIASHPDQLLPFARLSPKQIKTLQARRSKPTTWIVPASETCPLWLRGIHDGIAVRLTQHPLAKQLCEYSGRALVSTSANASGQAAARKALTVQRVFGQAIDLILHGETGHYRHASEILDIGSRQVLRRG